MDTAGFREYLAEREVTGDDADAAVELVAEFERRLQSTDPPGALATAGRPELDAFSVILIGQERNTWDNYIALLRYGYFVRNRGLYTAAMEYLDGHEAYGNLHRLVGEALGETLRDQMFAGADVPPLGLPNARKPELTETAVTRLHDHDASRCLRILGQGLRDLEDEWFAGDKELYEECGSVDRYLAEKRRRFIAELTEHRDSGDWWWVQEVTDEVVEYARANPEIGGGVRDGRTVYVAKIPYMAKEHLAATDDRERRYHYCHCPWVRESIRSGDAEVPPVFCYCSAGFHKKPWQVIFGKPLEAEVLETVLAGDRRCRFAIHLPEEAVLTPGE